MAIHLRLLDFMVPVLDSVSSKCLVEEEDMSVVNDDFVKNSR